MAQTPCRHQGAKSSGVESITIPSEVIKALDEAAKPKCSWEPWQDEVLRKYVGKVSHRKMGRILKKSASMVDRRIEALGLSDNKK